MKHRTRYSWLALVLLLILLGQGATQADSTTIDSSSIYFNTSIQLDSQGNPVIAYYNNFNLMLAHCNEPDCSTPPNINIVDNDPNGYIQNFSLALDSNDHPVISYTKGFPANGTLMLAHCDDPNCDPNMPTPNGDSILEIEPTVSKGEIKVQISMVLDGAGNPVISYADSTSANSSLRLVHCDDSNCDPNMPTPNGDSIQIVNNTHILFPISMVLDAGNPVIAYRNSDNQILELAHCNDPNCNPNINGAENIQEIDDSDSAGYTASLALHPSTGFPVISYLGNQSYDLKLAVCNNATCTNASGGFAGRIVVVDDLNRNGIYVSLALDQTTGFPIISYYDNKSLKLAYCTDATCNSRTITNLDTSASDAGHHLAMTLDRNNRPVISYLTTDDAANNLNTEVKLFTPFVVTLSPTTNAIENAANGQFTVQLSDVNHTDRPITVNYTVDGTGANAATGGVDYNTLSGSVVIPVGSQTATIDVVPFNDNISENAEEVTITLTGTDTIIAGVDMTAAGSQTITISDNDTAGVLVNPTGISAVEGGSAEYIVRLRSQPVSGETVTINISHDAGSAISEIAIDGTPGTVITLNANNWHIGAIVKVTPTNDTIANDNQSFTLSHAVTSILGGGPGPYNGLSASNVDLDVIDDESPNIVINPTAFTLDVNTDGTYQVSLSQQPGGNVTVALIGSSGCTYSANNLTFTPTGGATPWNTAQTVTVTGGNVPGVICNVKHAASGSGYDGVTGNDVNVFLLSAPDLSVTKMNSALNSTTRPGDTWTWTLNVTNTGDAAVFAAGDVILLDELPAGLTYSDMQVPGADQTDISGTISCNRATNPDVLTCFADSGPVTIGATTGAFAVTLKAEATVGGTYVNPPAGGAVCMVDSGDVVNEGNEANNTCSDTVRVSLPGELTLNATNNSTSENLTGLGQFTVDLGEPNSSGGPITVTYAVDETGLDAATAGVDYSTLPGSVEIPVDAQTVTIDIIPIDDWIDETDEKVILTLDSTNNPSITVNPAPAEITIIDNDTAEVLINPTGISAVEDGTTQYFVDLLTQPAADETVTVAVSIGSNATNEIASVTGQVTFTAADWPGGKTVSVKLEDDAIANGNRTLPGALNHRVTSSNLSSPYHDLATSTVTLDVIDNETPNIVVDPTAFILDVNQSTTYDVSLSKQPIGDVTVTLTSGSGCTVIPTTLTFGTTDWNTVQPVTVQAGGSGGLCTIDHGAAGGGYAGVTGKRVNVFVRTPPIASGGSSSSSGEASSITQTTVLYGDTNYVHVAVDNPYPAAGDTVTYTIIAHNPKDIPLTEVVIYDVFDYRLERPTLVSTSHGTGAVTENCLMVEGFTLGPGESATIIVSAVVSSALQIGETIPNAAILESPDASVHVSNLVLLGRGTAGNDGAAIAAQIILGAAQQLPNTGYAPTGGPDND
ncbi:Calx-beta domain-containing protein [Chloroflexota bacterium]